MNTSIYAFEAQDIAGKNVSLGAYQGKALLIVNTASACGFTPQFAGLEALHQWLSAQAPGLLGSKAIKWNFTKFLVGKDGRVIRRYAPQDEPASLAKDIEAALA